MVAMPHLAQAQNIEFQPREDARPGWSWLQDESWVIEGHRIVKLGGIKLRNRTLDRQMSFSCVAQVAAVKGGAVSDLGVRCQRAQSTEGDETEQLPVTGFDVRGIGIGSKREFKTASGRRLKKSKRQFFDRHFRDRDPTDRDPLEFLIPSGVVAVGDAWPMDLLAIQNWFGSGRFTMDMTQSYARVVFEEMVVRDGEPYGRLAFSTLLVPATIKDGEFTEARMALEGSALLPLRGDLPYIELQLATTIRFLGRVKAKGVRVNLDIDTRFEGSERRTPAP